MPMLWRALIYACLKAWANARADGLRGASPGGHAYLVTLPWCHGATVAKDQCHLLEATVQLHRRLKSESATGVLWHELSTSVAFAA